VHKNASRGLSVTAEFFVSGVKIFLNKSTQRKHVTELYPITVDIVTVIRQPDYAMLSASTVPVLTAQL